GTSWERQSHVATVDGSTKNGKPSARFPRHSTDRAGRLSHQFDVSVGVEGARQLLRQLRRVLGLRDRGAAHAAFPYVHVVLKAAADRADALHRPPAGGAIGGNGEIAAAAGHGANVARPHWFGLDRDQSAGRFSRRENL